MSDIVAHRATSQIRNHTLNTPKIVDRYEKHSLG